MEWMRSNYYNSKERQGSRRGRAKCIEEGVGRSVLRIPLLHLFVSCCMAIPRWLVDGGFVRCQRNYIRDEDVFEECQKFPNAFLAISGRFNSSCGLMEKNLKMWTV